MSGMKTEKIDFQGRLVRVHYEKLNGTLWLHLDGQTYAFAPERKGRKAGGGSSAQSEPGVVRAPMPGKIMKVFLRKGDKVAEGQDLLVMEAMKMEYVLKADLAGTISEIHEKENEQVALGQVLARIAAPDERTST